MTNLKSWLISFLMIFSVWVLLNSSLKPVVLGSGVIISILITALLTKKNLFSEMKCSPKSFLAFVQWGIVFSIELVKSNIDVLLRVISPKIRINPAIVEVKTKLQSKMGRLALANSITLTPGTLTVDVKNDKMYIHWIDATSTDVQGTTKEIVNKFEKYLEVIFG